MYAASRRTVPGLPGRAVSALASACVLLSTAVACGGGSEEDAALRFEMPPYVGVSCELPNSVECDRVGVAVRLRPEEPAERVEAWLNGRRVEMIGRRVTMRAADGGRQLWSAERTWVFEGFLDGAGLDGGPLEVHLRPDGRWLGVPPVRGKLRVVAHYSDGRAANRTVTVHLSPGWG